MKRYVKTIITIAATAAVTFSATSIFCSVNYSDSKKTDRMSNLKSKFDILNTYMESNYLYDDVDYQKAEDEALKAYVKSLDEPYTSYFSKDEFNQYIGNIEDSYVGIGVIVGADEEKDKIVVVSPFANSPAFNAGMKAGDYIVSVDGKTYNASGMNDCVKEIKSGVEGTSVQIGIERGGEVFELEITRGRISGSSVSSEMLDNNIGYIYISSFNTNDQGSDETTYTEFKDAVEELESEGMDKMIIDVRDNPGGVIDVVCDIADYILPEGIITYTETKDGKRHEYKSDKNEIDMPIVVLVNEHSASASEILTGALKDHDRAEIVGEKTYGKGIVQSVFAFADGSGVSMTTARYYTPDGECIHGIGIEPDVKVSASEKYKGTHVASIPHNEDTQLKKACEILNSNK